MIHVVAIITAKPGKRDEVLAHFRANMPAVHAEAGCIEYGPAIDAEGGPGAKYGADTFVVIEKWESLDHLKAHAASPHMQAYGAKTRELLANREIHVLSPAVEQDRMIRARAANLLEGRASFETRPCGRSSG